MDEFVEQVARALNLEERFHKQQAAHLANTISKIFGSE